MGGSISAARMMQLNGQIRKKQEEKVREFCQKVEELQKEYDIEIDSYDGLGLDGIALYLKTENGNVYQFEWDNGGTKE